MSTMDMFSRKTTARPSRVAGLVSDLSQRFERYKTYRIYRKELSPA